MFFLDYSAGDMVIILVLMDYLMIAKNDAKMFGCFCVVDH